MKETLSAHALGGTTLAVTVAANALNIVVATSLSNTIPAAQLLAFVAFAIELLVTAILVFFTVCYATRLDRDDIPWTRNLCWRFLSMGITVTLLSLPVSLATLIWLVVRRRDLHTRVAQTPTETLLILWFAVWGVSILLRNAYFLFLARWTKRAVPAPLADSDRHSDLDFGIGSSEMVEGRPTTRDTGRTFRSQDITLASPPRTPTTPRAKSSFRSSSSTKAGPGSSRTKLIHGSAKSSFEFPPFPAAEAVPVGNAFDRWDTSSVHYEVRAALSSSPPVTRSGLETIPGSRPESPADALDAAFLPSAPHASSSNVATAKDWVASSSRKASLTSCPSSPPNFSRPTSRSTNHPMLAPNLEELVHPLFRSTSPNPAPIATPGTVITASPLAGQPITPRTLSRMRSSTLPQASSTAALSETTGSSGSAPGSPGPGSPGPSIAEEEDLPPILPGFVLSAGQRSSLVGYGKRKSVKERPTSTISQKSRLSQVLGPPNSESSD